MRCARRMIPQAKMGHHFPDSIIFLTRGKLKGYHALDFAWASSFRRSRGIETTALIGLEVLDGHGL
jgi:hypothetical protein